MMSLFSSVTSGKGLINARVEIDSEAILNPLEKIKQYQLTYPEFNTFILDTFRNLYFKLISTISTLTFESIEVRILNLLKSRVEKNSSKLL